MIGGLGIVGLGSMLICINLIFEVVLVVREYWK